jgi:hypothetical protein
MLTSEICAPYDTLYTIPFAIREVMIASAAVRRMTCRYSTSGKPLPPVIAPAFSAVAGTTSISLSCGIRAS